MFFLAPLASSIVGQAGAGAAIGKYGGDIKDVLFPKETYDYKSQAPDRSAYMDPNPEWTNYRLKQSGDYMNYFAPGAARARAEKDLELPDVNSPGPRGRGAKGYDSGVSKAQTSSEGYKAKMDGMSGARREKKEDSKGYKSRGNF